MTASTPSFRPRLALAIAAALILPLSACKPQAPADAPADTAATTAPADGMAPAATTTAPAAAPAAATGAPAPTSLTETSAASAGVASGMCSIDEIDGARVAGTAASPVANASAVKISGWIGDDASKARPSEPALRVTGADGRVWEIALGAPVSRGDVAKHFGSDGMASAGFDATYDLSSLPAGDYAIGIAYDRGGARVLCDKGVHIRVGG